MQNPKKKRPCDAKLLVTNDEFDAIIYWIYLKPVSFLLQNEKRSTPIVPPPARRLPRQMDANMASPARRAVAAPYDAPYTPQSVRSDYGSPYHTGGSSAAPTPDKLQASIPVVMVRQP